MREPNREELRTLLRSWQKGLKTAQEVHEEAEHLMESCDWKTLPRTDPRSIQYEVLCQIDLLNQQLITAEDTGAFLDFLSTPVGEEEEAWTKWNGYWEDLDLDVRRKALLGSKYYGL